MFSYPPPPERGRTDALRRQERARRHSAARFPAVLSPPEVLPSARLTIALPPLTAAFRGGAIPPASHPSASRDASPSSSGPGGAEWKRMNIFGHAHVFF